MTVPPTSARGSDDTLPGDPWRVRTRAAPQDDNPLATYDAAMRGIAANPESVAMKRRAIVALAAIGATAKALAMLRDLSVDSGSDDELAALEARLAKEHALSTKGEERVRHALSAATLYECIHARTDGTFSGINAATMRLLAGDPERASMLARHVLEQCFDMPPASAEEAYHLSAIEAEAALLTGDVERAAAKLRMVRLLSGDDHAMRAALRRDLRRICDAKGLPLETLDVLKPPSVLHYTGYRVAPSGPGGKLPPASERYVADQIAAYLATREAGFGYGSLACGADILFAEALIARGAKLHVVLPAAEDAFCKVAVAPGRALWMRRFKACLAAAASVTLAGTEADECTDLLLAYGARLSMGLALLRARSLEADLEQAAVWDGEATGESWGPGALVAAWNARGMRTVFLDPGLPAAGSPVPISSRGFEAGRSVCAMLFGEITGCARLREPDFPVFIQQVMGAFGRVLDTYGSDVLLRSGWGCDFFVVLSGPYVAAKCALDLQAAVSELPRRQPGIPAVSLRLRAHAGPVFQSYNPLTKEHSFHGTNVTQASRVEPAAPEGEVFVTEPFAAALTLESGSFLCESVGQIRAADGLPMRTYVLKRA